MALQSETTFKLGSRVKALELGADGVKLLDQTALPHKVIYVDIHTAQEMAHAIETMLVRGAPAIGIAGAYGVVLSARYFYKPDLDLALFREQIREDVKLLAKTR